MTIDKITKIVFDSIKKVQKISGDEYTEIELNSKPRDCLTGFDSLREVETSIIIKTQLSTQLNKEIDFKKNIFYSKSSGVNTLEQIIENISKEILGGSNNE